MKKNGLKWFFACLMGITFACSAVVTAADLKIGYATEPSSIDPQYSTVGANRQFSQHIFDTLIFNDANLQLRPGLALSWRMLDDLTWEIKLRPNVKFHDGSEFNADDVVYTIHRIPKVKESPSTYERSIKRIAKIEVVDPLTIRFKMKKETPMFPLDLSFIFVISNQLPEAVASADFNKGSAAIGTGPFKFVEWIPGDRIVMKRHDNYWGKKTAWDKVTIRMIPNDPSRVTALLAGDVDFIDKVPPMDLERLKKDPKIDLWQTTSSRTMYIHMDTNRDQTPFVIAKDGSKLAQNPLKDLRIRRAISKAINREAIAVKLFHAAAAPTGQFVPKGMVGWVPDMLPEEYDPEGAKRLLAEAGYADGFAMTLHCTNNRYVNDEQVAQTVAQFLARIGIKMNVQAMPKNVFFSRATKREFSFFQLGFGNTTGDAARGLTAVLATYDKVAGMGANNRGRYSNPEFDRRIKAAAVTSDAAKREALLQEATRLAIGDDLGIIPLYFTTLNWATRKGLIYQARMDEKTLAHSVSVK